jgi:radical SAM protein with 4Fe4S-binding SPASM domain
MAAIDQTGSLYACHGAIYSSKKEALKSTTIHEDEFVSKLAAFSQSFEQPIKKVAQSCKECVATTCMICPVISHEKSQNEEFFEKWTDNWVNNLCGFFKAFGEIDRAVQAYNFREVQSQVKPITA